jgi:hypothetical protein
MDTNLVLRAAAAGNLTGDSTLTALAMGPMFEPLYLHTIVPSVSSGDKFAVKAVFKKSDDTVLLTITGPDLTAAGHSALEIFCDHPDCAKLVVTDDVTLDSTAAGSFGAVVQYLSNSRHS